MRTNGRKDVLLGGARLSRFFLTNSASRACPLVGVRRVRGWVVVVEAWGI